MWLSLNDSFIALCRDADEPEKICVRARRARDISTLFEKAEIQHTPNNDYQYRAYIDPDIVGKVIADRIININYRRFKPTCGDSKLHRAYMRAWEAMLFIQEPGTGGMYNYGKNDRSY